MIWSSVFTVWNFAFVLIYIYFVSYFLCGCLCFDIFFEVLRPFTYLELFLKDSVCTGHNSPSAAQIYKRELIIEV